MWTTVCELKAIVPGTGVCALVGDVQIAVFRPHADDTVYAIANIDPFANASVLSRGLICEHQGELWVASPLKKQRFRLRDGLCLENRDYSVASFAVRISDGYIEIQS